MAEIKKTTNYNLLTPSENDFFNVDHQNVNMGIIDAELKNLNDGKEALVKNAAAKESIADTDSLPLSDSADAQKTKKITFANLKAALKAYFDTLYNKYIHPEYTSRTSGLYKVTVDGTGHVSAAAAVAKSDITALGIPTQDTVTEIVDNLTSTDAAKALSAKQGKALSDLVSTVSTNVGNLDATKIKLPSGTASLYGLSGADANVDKALSSVPKAKFYGKISSLTGSPYFNDNIPEYQTVSYVVLFASKESDSFGNLETTNMSKLIVPPGASKIKLTIESIFDSTNARDIKITILKNGSGIKEIFNFSRTSGGGDNTITRNHCIILSANSYDFFQLYLQGTAPKYGGSIGGYIQRFAMEVLE